MARKQYETEEDLEIERAILQEVCNQWKCEGQKLPISYHLDYALLRDDKIVALIEIKNRNIPSDQYETAIIPVTKRVSGNKLGNELGVPAMLVLRYQDDIKFVGFSEEPDYSAIGGREDRGDWQDKEIVCHYARERFKSIYP